MTAHVAKDKVVSLTYVLRDQQGQVFEYSDLLVDYLHGSGQGLFDKIEHALLGRAVGEQVAVTLSPAEGFGEHQPALTFSDDLDNVPPEYRRLGAQVEAQDDKGEALTFTVTRIDNGRLTLDANHPLAGQTVTVHVTVKEIRDATADELRAGRPNPPPRSLQ